MLSTSQKGAIAETGLVHAAVRLGIDVYRPVQEGGRYDMILGVGHELLRVQRSGHGDVISVPCYSSRRTRDGHLKRRYTFEEVDTYGAYCADTERCYLLPIEEFGSCSSIQLRLAPTRNNQKRGVRWARDYELAATLRRQGP